MREILFRGKDSYGKWQYGNLQIQSNDTSSDYLYQIVPISMHEKVSLFDFVIPETVGQYTGFTDKNGKKIFEGDIISTDIKRPYLIVEFRDGCFMFNCNDGGEDYYDIMLPICKEAHTEYEYGEIIGNIHDNPELLKGGE